MTGLLDLPLELREPILFDVILENIQHQPETPESIVGNETYRPYQQSERWHAPHVCFCKPLQGHALPLLQVNRQIREEVNRLALRLLDQRIDDARVDVIYISDEGLWATWLSALCPTARLNTLQAQVRSYGTRLRPPVITVFRSSDIQTEFDTFVPNQHVACLLCDFLIHAIRGRAEAISIEENERTSIGFGCRKYDRTIQNVVIDIPCDSPSDSASEKRPASYSVTSFEYLGQNNGCFLCPVPSTSTKRNALALAQCLHEELVKILDIEPRHEHGGFFPSTIFEGIGTIHIKVGAKSFRSLDLGQILAELPRSEEWAHAALSRAEFFKWKRYAEERRNTAGFGVVSPSIQENELVGSVGLIVGLLTTGDESLSTLPHDGMVIQIDRGSDYVATFQAHAVFVQENGDVVTGKADFDFEVIHLLDIQGDPLDELHFMDIEGDPQFPTRSHVGEESEDDETPLFKGETIIIDSGTIISGDATFYGRAEDQIPNRLTPWETSRRFR